MNRTEITIKTAFFIILISICFSCNNDNQRNYLVLSVTNEKLRQINDSLEKELNKYKNQFCFDSLAVNVFNENINQANEFSANIVLSAFIKNHEPEIIIGDDWDSSNSELVGHLDTIKLKKNQNLLKFKKKKKFALLYVVPKPNGNKSYYVYKSK